MNINVGRTETLKKSSGTYDRVLIAAHLFHATANTAITAGAFDPNYVKVKVWLQVKDGAPIGDVKLSDSLQLLGTKEAFDKDYYGFLFGIDKLLPASGVKANKMRYVEIPFNHTRVEPGQELVCEITLAESGVFSSAMDETKCFVQAELLPSIGYHAADYKTEFIPIEANQTSISRSLGDNVTKIMLINFDKTSLSNPVISSCTLSSDRKTEQFDFTRLLTRTAQYVGPVSPVGIATALPFDPANLTVFRGLNMLPQTHILFDGEKDRSKLDKVNIEMTLNAADVAASQNFIAVTRYITNSEQWNAAVNRKRKHMAEETAKI